MKLYSQLNFGGNCKEAFEYYAKHLGGTITMMFRADQSPGAPANAGSVIVHARISVADVELIGNDVPPEYFQPIRSSYLYLEADSTEHAEKLWAALSEDGKIGIPFAETFYATRFGQTRDKFGVLWSIIHPKPMQP